MSKDVVRIKTGMSVTSIPNSTTSVLLRRGEPDMAVKTAVPLADIEKIRFLPRRTRSGQTKPECWGAKTTDGTWAFNREDAPGTPWSVTHLTTETVVDSYVSTLDDCRAYVASGQAMADLELILAHEQGEHEPERDTSCPRC